MIARTFFIYIFFTLYMITLSLPIKSAMIVKRTQQAIQESTKAHSEKPLKKNMQHRKRRKRDTYQIQKTISQMNFQELQEAKQKALEQGNKEAALKYINQMLKLHPSIQETCELTLEVSDILFDTGKLDKAFTSYTYFVQMFPGDPRIEYATYRALLCCFYTALDAEHDQTKTKETIARADEFLARTVFTTYQDEVIRIRLACYQTYVASELNVCSFYLNQGNIRAAQRRIDALRTHWSTKLPDLEITLNTLEKEIQLIQDLHTGKISSTQAAKQRKEYADILQVACTAPSKRSWKERF